MKTTLLLPLLLLGARLLALDPNISAPLYQHLVEVNREWLHVAPNQALLKNAAFATDRARIQKHLELVENELRASDVSSLSPAQKANRFHHLDVLHGYWQTGIFPTNHYHAMRQPYFRDNYGVLCAVGFLMWENGQQEIVNRINRENNYAYIAELAGKYPELGAWAQENGLSVEELAWIQPGYPAIQPNLAHWGNGMGLNPGERINTMLQYSSGRLIVAGHFSEIQGVPANNIAEWDGTAWHALGDGVNGEVFCLDYYFLNGTLYIGGDFVLPSEPTQKNVAQYHPASSMWTGLQTGDMEGRVLAIKRNYHGLYIGGDFKKVGGVDMPFLAQKSSNDWHDWMGKLSVNAPVRSIEFVNDQFFLFGGDFTEICSACPANDQQPASYLAYWSPFSDDWEVTMSGCPNPVVATAHQNGYLYAASKGEVSVLDAGIWYNSLVFGIYDSLPHGFLTRTTAEGDESFVYGGVSNETPGIGYWGNGLVQVDGPWYARGIVLADNVIRAAAFYNGDIYLAGDFTQLHDMPFSGLAILKKTTNANSTVFSGLPIQVVAANDHLKIFFDGLEQTTILNVYDLQGRLLARQTLPPGDGETTLDADIGWPNGLYVWQLQNSSGARTDKWAIIH